MAGADHAFWDGIPALMDWKRRVSDAYGEVRLAADPRAGWDRWREVRDELFGSHPQSPIPKDEREGFTGLRSFDHDPSYRVTGRLRPVEPVRFDIATSGDEPDGAYAFTRFARVSFDLRGTPATLDVFWLDAYGGGLFLPFRDVTSGAETYGAGRYLLDTVKGADLGAEDDGRLVLDFNYAYNPSCAYDPRWVCPLAPPANRLDVEVRAGELHPPRRSA
jgi:uncharacterized protein (DUF1684 family)